jgi:putative ABC transport system ATP-binding protein
MDRTLSVRWLPRSSSEAETARAKASQDLVMLEAVSKVYQTPAGDFPALRDVDLTIGEGEFAAILGKSGSGKSTLINVITGIDRPTSGKVWVGDVAVHTLTEEQIALWRGHAVGVIFQFFQLLPALTAVENVLLPMDFARDLAPSQRVERALTLLAEMGMEAEAHRFPAELSGGQQQRVAIARALANDPPLVVADEPTGNLDARAAATVMDLFETLVAERKTILMVTHDEALATRAGRRVVLADGQVVEDGAGDGARSLLRGKAETGGGG